MVYSSTTMRPNHAGAVSLAEKFAMFDDAFAPRRVAHVNDFVVKLIKVRGAFVWHRHPDTDELFVVHRGTMTVRYRDRDVVLHAGELHVVARGVELVEVADLETPGPWLDTLADDTCEVLAFEPAATVNTGDAGGDRTAHDEPFV